MADVEVTVGLDDSELKTDLTKIDLITGKVFKDAGKKASKSFSAEFKEGLTGGAGLQAAIGTFAGNIAFKLGTELFSSIKNIVSDSIGAAIESQESIARLNQGLKSVGRFSVDASHDLQAFADAMAKVTKHSDGEVISLLNLAQNYARTNTETKKLTEAAIELSARTGKDTTASLEFLGKTLQGIKGKMGSAIDGFNNLTEAQLRQGKGLDLVINKLQGSASAELGTFSGSLKMLSKGWEDLLQGIGRLVLAIPGLQSGINQAAQSFSNLAESIKGITDTKLSEQLAEIDQGLSKLDGKRKLGDSLGLSDFNKSTKSAINSWGAFTAAIKSDEESKIKILDPEQMKKDVLSLEAALNSANAAMAQSHLQRAQLIKDAGLRDTAIVQAYNEIEASVLNDFQQKKLDIMEKYKSVEGEALAKRNELLTALEQERIDKILGLENKLAKDRETTVTNGYIKVISVAGEAQSMMLDFAAAGAAGLSDAFSSMGTALAHGENSFEAFGQSILASIGKFMIQVGTSLIAVGVAETAFMQSLETLNGPLAIAAGAALVVAGAAFIAATKKGSKGVGGNTSGTSTPSSSVETPVVAPKTTAVSINVEGTVLNPREVGMQIAQILSDTFDSNDTRIVAS